MPTLAAGDKAPDFTVQAITPDGERTLRLRDLRGQVTVLYFYPKDDTPGCTREAQAFSAAQKDFAKLGIQVLAVSKDPLATHEKFQKKYALTIPLLSDPDLALHNAYGTYGEKTMYGKKTTGTLRTTFVIDTKGTVARVFSSVKVDGHADAVLDFVRTLAPQAAKAVR